MAEFWAFYAMLLIKVALTGVPWTEEEHRRFLLGLQKLGKGDWRGISRNFVVSRTPTQVASHAQKYFIRQSNMSRRKRRSSLFDMVPDEVTCLVLVFISTQILLAMALFYTYACVVTTLLLLFVVIFIILLILVQLFGSSSAACMFSWQSLFAV
jgi:SHAQKYF class myb-like DNA-binding protein